MYLILPIFLYPMNGQNLRFIPTRSAGMLLG